MDELCALEREEALRRADYEAKHAEALRRAESQSRHLQTAGDLHSHSQSLRLSKSATTSPIMQNGLMLTTSNNERNLHGISVDRGWHSPPPSPTSSGLHRANSSGKDSVSKRRFSGPIWMPGPEEQLHRRSKIPQSRSSGHLVETIRHSSHFHPYQQYRHAGEISERRGKHVYDEFPSPPSSDGEQQPRTDRMGSPNRLFQFHGPSSASYGHATVEYSPPHNSSAVRTATAEFASTPSTSPFLGPLRTLNIHSANPSRAPSPILLPLPASSRLHDSRDVIISDDSMTSSTRSSFFGNLPSSAGLYSRSSEKTQQRLPGSSRSDQTSVFQNPHSSNLSSSLVPTPVLSSGPSSNGSSPGSIPQAPSPTGLVFPVAYRSNGTISASSSRPPSPHHVRGSSPSNLYASRHRHHFSSSSHQYHNSHHLAHSVRVAFGMTPIHSHPASRRSSPPLPPLPRNTSWSSSPTSHQLSHHHHSHTAQSNYGNAVGVVSSTPGSRAPSPPIKLPALKMRSDDGNGGDNDDEGDVKMGNVGGEATKRAGEKVELPHFSEFEAATRLPLSGEPVLNWSRATACPESKMSIDFVKSWCLPPLPLRSYTDMQQLFIDSFQT